MQALDDSEAWRQVPPEVKLEIMSRAHSKGLMTSIGFIMIGCTCAVALKFVWFMWGALLLSPIIFQISANKAWRALRPATILRYLAAKSAARRYAYSAKARDLSLDLIFPATLQRIPDTNDVTATLEAAIQNNQETEVWVTLFKDTIVMMSEQIGGAKMEMAQKIDKYLDIDSVSESGKDYASDKEVLLTITTPSRHDIHELIKNKYKLTSRYPAALVVFEKKVQQKRNEIVDELIPKTVATSPKEPQFDDSDDDVFARQFN
jgi:hypothetical protein